MEICESSKICTDYHHEKSIAQAASKVKSLLITYACEFPGVKKGISGGARCWGDFSVIGKQRRWETSYLILLT